MLHFTYLTYFGFLQYYKTPSFEENENKHQDCHKNPFFFFLQKNLFLRIQKACKRRFTSEIKKNALGINMNFRYRFSR